MTTGGREVGKCGVSPAHCTEDTVAAEVHHQSSLISAPGGLNTVMRRITKFRSTTDRIYDGGPIILQYNIIILTIVLQLPTVISTVTCCTGL